MSNSIGEMCRLLPRGSRVTLLFEHRPPDFRVLDSRETRGVDLCFRRGKPHDYADLQAALSTSVGGVAGAVDTVVLMPRTDASDDDERGSIDRHDRHDRSETDATSVLFMSTFDGTEAVSYTHLRAHET